VFGGFYTERAERVEVLILDIKRGRLQDDLILEIMEKAVGILTVAAVGRAPYRVDISHLARVGLKYPKEGGGTHGGRAFFQVIGLADDTALLGPKVVELKYYLLKSKRLHKRDYIK
jgi:hypothetical protein